MILKMSVLVSLSLIGFVGIAHADSGVTIYPSLSSGMMYAPDGLIYHYDFEMSTHNQTVTIQQVDFIINDTDTTLYSIDKTMVGVEGNYDVIPLKNLGESMDAYDVTWFYNYQALEGKPMVFKPDAKTPNAIFGFYLFTPFKIYQNLGMSVRVHYLSPDGKTNTVTSVWQNIPQEHRYNAIQDQTQQIIDQNKVIEAQNTELILLQLQYNKLLATQICAKDFMVQSMDGIDFLDGFTQCQSKVLGVSK
jgi:hypothetical protein